MKDLIEALNIFLKYMSPEEKWPTHCEHDVLHVLVDPSHVNHEDKLRLKELSFIPSDNEPYFMSFRFGSA